MTQRFLFLRVSGKIEIPLGAVVEPADIPDLLRHVADYYDDNPDSCAQLFDGVPPRRPASYVSDPFSVR